MRRYFFHARLRNDLVPDDVGMELSDDQDLRSMILDVLRESGLELSSAWTFEIVDDAGDLVMRVPIADLQTKQ